MFKLLRIAVLLFVLMTVAATYLVQRNVAQDWNGTLLVQIVPVIADAKPRTKRFVEGLKDGQFAEIEEYLIQQAERYGRNLSNGFELSILAVTNAVPPPVPAQSSGAMEKIIWSLRLRWWAWRNNAGATGDSVINLYILYQSPDDNEALPHSTGLQNGLIGLINARALDRDSRLHNVIVTHELMHILGAHDKYDFTTGAPHYPIGVANPSLSPQALQRKAEIMGRARPLGNGKYEVVKVLARTVVGTQTAKEIGWL